MRHRLLVGYDVTDELFGLAISYDGWLDPYYMYGAILVAAPSWAVGTALGVVVGNLLPARVVSALSVALYGMFLCHHHPAGAPRIQWSPFWCCSLSRSVWRAAICRLSPRCLPARGRSS